VIPSSLPGVYLQVSVRLFVRPTRTMDISTFDSENKRSITSRFIVRNPVSHPMGASGSFPGGKAAGS
jgi:hypothetical protein